MVTPGLLVNWFRVPTEVLGLVEILLGKVGTRVVLLKGPTPAGVTLLGPRHLSHIKLGLLVIVCTSAVCNQERNICQYLNKENIY